MSKYIWVVDYGLGNLHSVGNALERVGGRVRVGRDPCLLEAASAVVLPGVGAFDTAATNLKRRGLFQPLSEYLRQDRPFLGICLGFQLLFEGSGEGRQAGLGIVPEKMVQFPEGVKQPHIGWNRVHKTGRAFFLENIADGAYFYFVHSYCGVSAYEAGRTEYGRPFTSALIKGNVCATQFHPEKSGRPGLQLLKNFVARFAG